LQNLWAWIGRNSNQIEKTLLLITEKIMTQCKCGPCETLPHDSDCAVHNEPATPNGDCDCKGGWISVDKEGFVIPYGRQQVYTSSYDWQIGFMNYSGEWGGLELEEEEVVTHVQKLTAPQPTS
jgi:hypothetical protein